MAVIVRPTVTVQPLTSSDPTDDVPLPDVMRGPIRPDIVTFVHSNISRNSRQPYAVSKKAGKLTSAVSWGTGRDVSRIPRVRGGGTHRAGEGALGNMCRGGPMFGPTKTFRRWGRKVNVKQKRYAVVLAIAASAVPSLVMARGHVIDSVPGVPLVVSDAFESVDKTCTALAMLTQIGAFGDLERVKRSVWVRKGPLVVYGTEGAKLVKAVRNIPGVDICHVSRLNLLTLAPGGHLGRFVIWTKKAFVKLDTIYGPSGKKLPRAKMFNGDVARIINSDEVQSVVRPIKDVKMAANNKKKNPLKNLTVMMKLNPFPFGRAAGQMALMAVAKENKLSKDFGRHISRAASYGLERDAKRREALDAAITLQMTQDFVVLRSTDDVASYFHLLVALGPATPPPAVPRHTELNGWPAICSLLLRLLSTFPISDVLQWNHIEPYRGGAPAP